MYSVALGSDCHFVVLGNLVVTLGMHLLEESDNHTIAS